MKRFLRSKLVLSLAAIVMIAAAVVIPLSGSITHSFAASRSSHNIAYVNYDDSGFTGTSTSQGNIFADSVVGGPAPTSSNTDSVTYNGMTFTPLAEKTLSTSTLAPYDTLILFEVCDIATSLSSSQHAAINAFLVAGNKILLYDADRCAPVTAGNGAVGSANYSWFTFPFATSNPGPQGKLGKLTIVENSTLTTKPNILAHDPFSSDELGDANTATTSNPNWFAAAKTTNALGVNGFFLAYARNKGLIIYDGADHWFTAGPTKSLTDLFVNELDQQYDPDNLPSTTPIALITLANENWAGYISAGTKAHPATYSIVEGAWTVPTAHCFPHSAALSRAAFWVGMGGFESTGIEQIATEMKCFFTHPIYDAVYENYPQAIVPIDQACKGVTITGNPQKCPKVNAVVKPGDKMFGLVRVTGIDKYELSLTNFTQKWLFTTTQTVKGVKRDSAECVAERPSSGTDNKNGITLAQYYPVANFDTVHFSSCSANNMSIATAGTRLIEAIITENGKSSSTVLAQPGVLLTKTGSFDVLWEASGGFVLVKLCFFCPTHIP